MVEATQKQLSTKQLYITLTLTITVSRIWELTLVIVIEPDQRRQLHKDSKSNERIVWGDAEDRQVFVRASHLRIVWEG